MNPGASSTKVFARDSGERMGLVHRLDWDRVDVIGDVHGEVVGLRKLLARLGCDPERATVERPLIFVGDLIDRGPDSVEVVAIVQRLVQAGVARAVLGNHELNVLGHEKKEGNGWFEGREDRWHSQDGLVAFESRPASADEQKSIIAFFNTLPVALESDTLRIVHAAWIPAAIEKARRATTLRELRAGDEVDLSGIDLGGAPSAKALADASNPIAYHAGLAEQQLRQQNSQPVKVLTSGVERPIAAGTAPQFLSGKWRMLERDPWWTSDDDPRAVVFGHYWRRRSPETKLENKPEPLDGVDALAWFGKSGQAFCVDYSAGYRYKARHWGQDPQRAYALAALRWPERVVYFDDDSPPLPTTNFRNR